LIFWLVTRVSYILPPAYLKRQGLIEGDAERHNFEIGPEVFVLIAESANTYAARARTEALGEQARVTAAATVYSVATVDNDDEDESKASRASHCRLNCGFFVFSQCPRPAAA
jgi:hypothetical protein